jgi:hypothetical protein
MARIEDDTHLNDPLTSLSGTNCANPFCQNLLPARAKYGPAKRYCCQQCRLDGYVIRRASEMMTQAGVPRFFQILNNEEGS